MADNETTVIETQPTEPEYNSGRNWLRVIGLILTAIIVAVLLIFAARWVYNAVTDDNSRRGSSTQPADENKLPTKPGEDKTKPQTSSTNTSTLGGSNQPGSQSSGTGNKLPNSGPEHVAAIFAGSSLAGAGLHYLINRKRHA